MSPLASFVVVSSLLGMVSGLEQVPALRFAPRRRLRPFLATDGAWQQNLGTVFTIWDRSSGRLLTRDASPDERTGVPGELDLYPQRFLDALGRPLREARARAARARPAASCDPTPDAPVVSGLARRP